MKINSNLPGMLAAQQLGKAYTSYSDSINRISTGRRINKASDDASGLTISDRLNSQALGMGQAMKNANDAISVTQIADGALEEAVNLINTIKTKSIQAANDAQSPDSRQAIQSDINNALESLDRISQTTSFNGQKLLSGEFTDKKFQVGTNPNETVDISIAATDSSRLGSNKTGSLSSIDVTTFDGAQKAIQIADEALGQVDAIRSAIGATQNQLTSTINTLANSQINIFASESAIRDIDYAEEAMNLSRLETLTKARAFAAAQANASYKNVMSIFSGTGK
ncbi:MAG: flagellin FliC [Proteobacteria bacterium]|nr:flagellin FliC [Pseudomonadota bacterium]